MARVEMHTCETCGALIEHPAHRVTVRVNGVEQEIKLGCDLCRHCLASLFEQAAAAVRSGRTELEFALRRVRSRRAALR